MSKKEFNEAIVKLIKERYSEGYEVRIEEVKKNNELTLTGLIIRHHNTNVAPTIYLDNYYDDNLTSGELAGIVDEITNVYERNKVCDFNVNNVINFETVKDKICFKLINIEKNKERLENIPAVPFMDLAVIFYIPITCDSTELVSITVTNNLMFEWETTTDVLYELAKVNTPRTFKARVASVGDTLSELLDMSNENEHSIDIDLDAWIPMYVATNSIKQHGASVILYEGLLDTVAEKFGCSFYIIPSSIHECILVPISFVDNVDTIKHMVVDVNATEVPVEEILSDSVYLYSVETKELKMC